MIWNLFLIQYELKMEYLKSWDWEYKFLEIDKNQKLLDYIENKIYELAKSEGVEVFILPEAIINEKEVNKEKWASGKFKWLDLKDMSVQERESYQKKVDMVKKLINPTDPYYSIERRKLTYPRIELISESQQDSRIMTFLHEMGHYFIYKKDEEQSETKADLYIPEFFDTHLPPFFKWVFQCWLSVYGRKDPNFKEIKYKKEESFQYWNDYQNFIK